MRIVHWTEKIGSGMSRVAEEMAESERLLGLDVAEAPSLGFQLIEPVAPDHLGAVWAAVQQLLQAALHLLDQRAMRVLDRVQIVRRHRDAVGAVPYR